MNFNQYAFADIIKLVSEKIKVQDLSKTNYISTENMLPNFGGVTAIDDLPNSNSCNKFSQKDVLFSNIRTYFKKVWFADFNGGCSPDVLVMRSKDENILLNEYLFLLIRSDEFINFTIISSNGAKMPRGDKNAIKKYIFNIPSIDYQKKCIEHYFVIDQKIQLNTQTNQTLEALAQAIFKSWFVDFDPVRAKAAALSEGKSEHEANLAAMSVICGKDTSELNDTEYKALWEIADAFPSELVENAEFGEVPKGWEIKYLKDICNIVYGKNLPTSKLLEQGYPVFGGNGIIGYYDQFLYEEPQTLVSCRGAASGKVLYSLPNSFVTNNSLVIEHKNSGLSSYYIYESLMLQNLSELTSGSAQPQMTIANMNGVKILVPTPIIHSFYSGMVSYFYKSRYEKQIENEKLSIIRDELLPKLLSGEV